MAEPTSAEIVTVRLPGRARGRTWLGQLERALNQSGAIVGEVYALAARGVLSRLEQIEDRAVERRYRRRTQPLPARANARETPRPQSSPSTSKTSD